MTSFKQKQHGFTLVEMMIVLAIIAIIASIAAPSFEDLIQNNRMTTQYNTLLASLSLARSEAVKRNTTVTICKSDDQDASPTCGGDWHDGWLVFADVNGDGVFDASDELIRVHEALSGDNTLSFGARNRITFSGDGMALGGANGTFTLCDSRGDSERKGLIISPTGRARHAVSADVLVACPT